MFRAHPLGQRDDPAQLGKAQVLAREEQDLRVEIMQAVQVDGAHLNAAAQALAVPLVEAHGGPIARRQNGEDPVLAPIADLAHPAPHDVRVHVPPEEILVLHHRHLILPRCAGATRRGCSATLAP
ncbi:MAG: hypothetical protein M3361_14135 [Candidatus Tectomicrobia bacterium]|nr:hypothetical protein [Candidatus Tectomicrobia bacterium]